MADDAKTRWMMVVSKETDISVHGFLARHGLRKRDLSKCVEDAVRWRLLDQALAEARAGFADLTASELQGIVDSALQER